jgi:hypothetical protein
MPATWVACSDSWGSNGRAAYFHFAPGGGNARATITFAVVKRVLPFGNPRGAVYPDGLKNRCAWSTPSSMIPILIPWPAVARPGPQSAGALIISGVSSRLAW